jgi:hypothetical protein
VNSGLGTRLDSVWQNPALLIKIDRQTRLCVDDAVDVEQLACLEWSRTNRKPETLLPPSINQQWRTKQIGHKKPLPQERVRRYPVKDIDKRARVSVNRQKRRESRSVRHYPNMQPADSVEQDRADIASGNLAPA